MAKNDIILIDSAIDDRVEHKIPTDKRDEVFEFFVFEQLLKDYDLSKDEILNGCIDGRNDGGIDGFFIFVNGHLLSEVEKFAWPKTGCTLEIWVITCKHHDTFKQAPLDNLVASISELWDFSIEAQNLKGDYSEELITQRDIFKLAYRKMSSRLTSFRFVFGYASRGNTDDLGESIISRGEQLKKIAVDSFASCTANFVFWGSTELVELFRKKNSFKIELPFSDYLSSGETYILLVKLIDYYHFISEENKLRRYLFDSNVRDFMGMNTVNEDIKETLMNENSPDFWWLNNGITILATKAIVIGNSIQIEDIQVVNGLQTSESIFRFFSSGGIDPNVRSLLVKVIVSNNSESRDQIIRATNNQTVVEPSALHATDKIQRDIEDVLKLNDFYYERRTNLYKNQNIVPDKIVSPLYLASGFINLILKDPIRGTNLKSKNLRNESTYNMIFSNKTDLKVWHKIAAILKKTDQFLESQRPGANSSSVNFLKSRRQFLSFLTISRLIGDFNFSVNDLIQFDIEKISIEEFQKSWILLLEKMPLHINKNRIKWHIFILVCRKLVTNNGVTGIKRLNKNFHNDLPDYKGRLIQANYKNKVTPEFINQVDMLLPKQPWKAGIQKEIALKLSCNQKQVYLAISNLIEERKRYNQHDGVLYDYNGNVITHNIED